MKVQNLITLIRYVVSLSAVLLLSAFSNAQSSSPSPATAEAKLLSSPQFVLSQEAIDAGIDGTLLIAAKLDSTGAVKSARVIAGPEWPCGRSPNKEIEKVKEIVIENIKRSKFSPEIKNGKPVATDIGLNFWIGRAYKDLMKKREAEARQKAGLPHTISGGVINGKARSLPKPAYPVSARSERASGAVSVSVLVDESGKVVAAGATNGHPLLQEPAREAACGARFDPTTLKGKLVRVSGVITYAFVAPR